MTGKQRIQCACGGWVSKPNRRITLEQAFQNHTKTCPRAFNTKEKP